MPSTTFMLNQREVTTDMPPGSIMLDYIRVHSRLTGTKIGCREGDCGACTILVGDLRDGVVRYRSMTSCLMPLGNAHGKHIVTIEGLNRKDPTPVQQAMMDHGATQCGFCTVGFVVSLVGFCLQDKPATTARAVAAMDGNICRCTGYKSIERAAATIADGLKDLEGNHRLKELVKRQYLPDYFATVPQRLAKLNKNRQSVSPKKEARVVGGGTDLYVQVPEDMQKQNVALFLARDDLRKIHFKHPELSVGAACTVTDLWQSDEFITNFPNLDAHMKLVSSTPIRNMATIGGNFVNASPIGDMTIFFLALDARLILRKDDETRRVMLSDFYKGYKKLDLEPGEIIETITFRVSDLKDMFNFEKVSKRTHLDIASVNSAARFRVVDGVIHKAVISAGGVGPVPMVLHETGRYLAGRKPNHETIEGAADKAAEEISPISDARGSAAYKQLLLKQLIVAHFLAFFPQLTETEVRA